MSFLYIPEGYSLLKEIDLQRNKNTAIMVNVFSIAIMILMFIIGLLINPIQISMGTIIRLILAMICIIAYIFLHELTHGFFIRKFCGEKADFGFTGMYAYAGKKEAYFCKKHYMIISLSPLIIWGIAIFIINILVPISWFWVVYFVQIMNISGAAGDIYVSYILFKLPDNTLANDDGTSMRFYTK